jgi:hypothetical protein
MNRNFSKVALVFAAVLLGVILALRGPSVSSAVDTERFRFMAAVAEISGSNELWCFGESGWHGDDGPYGADVWANDTVCGDSTSDEAWLHAYGLSTFWDDFWMPAYIYDGAERDVYDECKNVLVDVYRWTTGSVETYLGSEWYIHVDSDPDFEAQLWLGNPNWSLNSFQIGDTRLASILGATG